MTTVLLTRRYARLFRAQLCARARPLSPPLPSSALEQFKIIQG